MKRKLLRLSKIDFGKALNFQSSEISVSLKPFDELAVYFQFFSCGLSQSSSWPQKRVSILFDHDQEPIPMWLQLAI